MRAPLTHALLVICNGQAIFESLLRFPRKIRPPSSVNRVNSTAILFWREDPLSAPGNGKEREGSSDLGAMIMRF